MLSNLKASIQTYVSHLQIYDYLAFGWLFLLCFFFFILVLVLIRKKPFLALFVLILDAMLLVVSPFAIKWYLDAKFRSNEAHTTLVKQLQFSDMLIVEGSVKNTSKIDFTTCLTHINVLKLGDNPYKNILLSLKPIRNQSILLQTPPAYGQETPFRVIFEPFVHGDDFNVTVNAECY